MVFEGVIILVNGKCNELIVKVYDGVYYFLDECFGNFCDVVCLDVMMKVDLYYFIEFLCI